MKSEPSSTADVKPPTAPTPGKKHKKHSDSDTQTPTKRTRTPGSGQKWTAAELEQLLDAAIGSVPGIKDFEGKIAGRTGNQCATNWKNRIKPFLVEALRKRAEEGGKNVG